MRQVRLIKDYASNTLGVNLELECVDYQKAPAFLGEFGYKAYGWVNDTFRGKTEGLIRAQAQRLSQLIPEQNFTTVFVQRYFPYENVYPHKDPMNNLGYTIIGVYGNYDKPTITEVEGFGSFYSSPGDVLILPCTFGKQQGPKHSVRWQPQTNGVRYTIILNTIV